MQSKWKLENNLENIFNGMTKDISILAYQNFKNEYQSVLTGKLLA